MAEVLVSSQSAFLISRPCSLLLRHSVNVGYFLFYFIQRSFVIQYLYPWVGNASFLCCEKLVSVWHSISARTLRCCDTWIEEGKKREPSRQKSEREQKCLEARHHLSSPPVCSVEWCPFRWVLPRNIGCLCHSGLCWISVSHQSSSAKDADREFGESSRRQHRE